MICKGTMTMTKTKVTRSVNSLCTKRWLALRARSARCCTKRSSGIPSSQQGILHTHDAESDTSLSRYWVSRQPEALMSETGHCHRTSGWRRQSTKAPFGNPCSRRGKPDIQEWDWLASPASFTSPLPPILHYPEATNQSQAATNVRKQNGAELLT